MNYAKIDKNDITNGEGVCVSLWVSGCPEPHCPGCHNSEIWDFESGQPFTEDTMNEILSAISANGIQRNFSILGGEPLAPQNISEVANIILKVREKYPNIKIYLWTGYELESLKRGSAPVNPRASSKDAMLNFACILALPLILNSIDCLIDGPYIEAERDITLKLRGSSNQHIWKKESNQWIMEE